MNAPARPAPRWTEWLTVLVLLAMAGTLLWVNVSLLRRRRPPAVQGFDLKNPMLDARVRECVEAFSPDTPRDAACISVRTEGVVLRPASGPASIGERAGLKRVAPYLAASERRAAPGSTCADGKAGVEDLPLLYPLNAFGLPSENVVRPDSVRPMWVEVRGKERLVYEVILEDMRGWTWQCYLTPDALVMGLVEVQRRTQTAGARAAVVRYTDIGECP